MGQQIISEVEIPPDFDTANILRLASQISNAAMSLERRLSRASSEDYVDCLKTAYAIQKARRFRDALFPEMFADPAWDILLDLYIAHEKQDRVSVSSACIAAAVPPTTALRWLTQMVGQKLVLRHQDENDGRRVFVSLTPEACARMEIILHRFHGIAR